MTIQESTPNVPPIPRTFNIGLDANETAGLLELLKESLSKVPADASTGDLSFCNIRIPKPAAADRTAVIQVQYIPATIATAAARVLPAASTAAATTAAPAAAAPAPATTAKAS